MIANPKDPSYLSALLTFERAAFHLSFTKAAADLGLTPSAISHRIAALESALQRKLFIRQTRSIRLSREGASLASDVAEIWDNLQELTTKITSTDALRISLGPYFSSSWLMPRLRDFERQNPNVRVELVHAAGAPDLRNADLAIFWTDADVASENAELLFEMTCVPVAMPGLCRKDAFVEARIAPLHYRDRSAWHSWLEATDQPARFADEGDMFDDPHLLFEAAAHGRGVAMGLLPFISNLMKAGRLVAVSNHAIPSPQSYLMRIVDPSKSAAHLFADWVRGTIRSEAEATAKM